MEARFFPARANTGDPNGPIEACPLMRPHDPRQISRRGNRYLRVLFVQAAWVVLVRIKNWERYGLKSWIEAAKRRLHHNVLAIALANKLARIAWAVLAKGRAFELTRTDDAGVRPA